MSKARTYELAEAVTTLASFLYSSRARMTSAVAEKVRIYSLSRCFQSGRIARASVYICLNSATLYLALSARTEAAETAAALIPATARPLGSLTMPGLNLTMTWFGTSSAKAVPANKQQAKSSEQIFLRQSIALQYIINIAYNKSYEKTESPRPIGPFPRPREKNFKNLFCVRAGCVRFVKYYLL